MNTYNFTDYFKIFFCGGNDCSERKLLECLENGMTNGIEHIPHPKELERIERMNIKRGISSPLRRIRPAEPKKIMRGSGRYNDSVIFVCGCLGMGSKEDNTILETLDRINELAKLNNSHILVVRSHNDDPSYFTEHKIDLSNVKLIEDYSIINLNGYNCLCIGGGVPIDRQWRIKQTERTGKPLYFKNCGTFFDKELLDKILDENKIGCVITNDAPTFIPPHIDASSSIWTEDDPTILTEITNQRTTIDMIYMEFVKKNNKPYVWCFNSRPNQIVNNDIKYQSSNNPGLIYDLQDLCSASFGHGLDGKKIQKKNLNFKPRKPRAIDYSEYQPIIADYHNAVQTLTMEDIARATNIIQHREDLVGHITEPRDLGMDIGVSEEEEPQAPSITFQDFHARLDEIENFLTTEASAATVDVTHPTADVIRGNVVE